MSKTKNIKASGWLLSVAITMLLLFLQQCNANTRLLNEANAAKEKAERELNNYLAAEETIARFVNENNLLISKVRSYEFEITDLTVENKALIKKYNIILSENKKLKNVNNLLSAEIEFKDSLLATINVTPVDQYTSVLSFNKKDDYDNGNSRNISGKLSVTFNGTDFTSTPISINSLSKISLLAALKEEDGVKYLEIGTKYPGVTINKVENIELVNSQLNKKPEKKAGWSVGVGAMYGASISIDGTVQFGPSIGIGTFWSPKWLRF